MFEPVVKSELQQMILAEFSIHSLNQIGCGSHSRLAYLYYSPDYLLPNRLLQDQNNLVSGHSYITVHAH
jgi:hypothetical protein